MHEKMGLNPMFAYEKDTNPYIDEECGVIIMGGGKGERLHPDTLNRPKPLVPVRERPMIDYSLHPAIRLTGRVAITACYLASQVEEYITENYPQVACRTEPAPLHTGGSLKWNRDFVDAWKNETLVVLMGDHARKASLTEIVNTHYESGNDVTLIASPSQSHHNQLIMDRGLVKEYLASGIELQSGTLASTGEYVFSWPVLRQWLDEKTDDYFDIGWGIVAPMVASNEVKVGADDFGPWVDLGTWENIRDFEEKGWDI